MVFSVVVTDAAYVQVRLAGRLLRDIPNHPDLWVAIHSKDIRGEPAITPELAILSLFPEGRIDKLTITTE